MDRRKRAIRLAELLTQSYSDLSRRTDISASTFDKWKSGRRNPSVEKLKDLARIAEEQGRLLMNESASILAHLNKEEGHATGQEELFSDLDDRVNGIHPWSADK